MGMIIPYLYLFLTGLCLTAMSLLRKEFDRRTAGMAAASMSFIAITYFFVLLVCVCILAGTGDLANLAAIDGLTLLLGLAFALATFITTVICIVGASYGSTSLLVVFATLGTVTLSTFYGLIFDPTDNKLSVFKVLGLVAVLAIIVMNFLDKDKAATERDAKQKRIYRLLCFFIFFTNGIALVIYYLLSDLRPQITSASFISLYSVICILFALLGLGVFALRSKKRNGGAMPLGVNKITLLIIAAYAVCFWASEALSLANVRAIPILIQAPLSFAIPTIVLTVSEAVIYKTAVTKSTVLKMAFAILCSVLFVL